ncbi:hypothetical protein AWM75_03725 [Aerococcus urinaehominis]|uniref:Uncharacterized protein n=1 Tax=Aerococcus urinaehominis TaxID=128944 RepID=A0A0X8FKU7_9LACT|nr:septum formation initiator family protein [Aerococcus urinaehominis]AMB99167.1 hypothetical protein AWM75_03725 [Aerococcus urinaehominis]SDM06026.1 cell division protein DivIC [Aerococcus urinaehominis]
MSEDGRGKQDNLAAIDDERSQAALAQQQYRQKLKQRQTKLRKLIMMTACSVMLLFSLLSLSQFIRSQMSIRQMEQEISHLSDQVASEEEVVAVLENQANLLKDDAYVAKLARSRYYLSKDDEIIFSLPEDNDSKQAQILNRVYQDQKES